MSRNGTRRSPTTTALFGSSRRESHDASGFYDRFVAPELSTDEAVAPPSAVDVLHCHDARDMASVATGSVALVVTSPPYFAGKEYEQSLGEGGVPATYFEYLGLLRDVFAECARVLEPGGRIAVNVANLGRRPYRSLAGDVTQILQDLGLLLRGEVIWWKGRAAGGSCAWGTFQRPANPVLRDITERVVIASKGRFDRALSPQRRAALGLPSSATISRDEFLEATTDLWEIAPESATRVGHPAPFPVELPRRLIELYTYQGDLVLDPFMGVGSTAVAAVRTGRHYVGFDTDPAYLGAAEQRIAEAGRQAAAAPWPQLVLPGENGAVPQVNGSARSGAARAVQEGRKAGEVAALLLAECGFTAVRPGHRLGRLGIQVSYLATDASGRDWAFDVSGGFTTNRRGLRRTDELWRALGKAAVLHAARPDLPLVLLTTDLPSPTSPAAAALAAVRAPAGAVAEVLHLLDPTTPTRLHHLAAPH